MDDGGVPPPRRSTPRSLTGPPRAHTGRNAGPQTQAQQGNQTGPFVQLISHEEEIMELRHIVSREAAERERLQTAFRDEVARFDRSMHQQRQLEEELVSKDAMIDNLAAEIRQLKQKKQSVDSELAQSTADYMNSQTNWLEQASSLNDEILLLKGKVHAFQENEKYLTEELKAYRDKEAAADAEQQAGNADINETKDVRLAAEALEKHQNELLIKELRSYHAKLREEMQELKDMNERLKDDNEHYQYLLVENTITGKWSSGETVPELQARSSSSSTNPSRATSVNMTAIPEGNATPDRKGEVGLSLADDEVLYDMDSLKPTAAEASAGDEDSLTSLDSTESLQRVVNRQQFELRSLQNYNRALKLSLERLVDRLLDNKNFSRAVEETVSRNTVQTFRSRVASYSDRLGPEPALKSSPVRSSGSSATSQASASVWTDMILNSQYTGAPNRRVISLGVDNEFRAPPQPTQAARKPGDASPTRSDALGMRYIFGHPKRASPTPAQAPNDNQLHVAKRTESITGLRKLKLTEPNA